MMCGGNIADSGSFTRTFVGSDQPATTTTVTTTTTTESVTKIPGNSTTTPFESK